MQLKGKTAIVTGASSGIGLAFAEALVTRGAHVFGLARRTDKLERIEGQLGNYFRGVRCDVSNPDDVRRAFDEATGQTGRLDVLVNNAGIAFYRKVEEMSLEEWDTQMATNLRGVFLCSKAAVPIMREQNGKSGFGGHIVHIASVAGLVGNPSLAGYNASKFGLRGFSEALMKEVRNDGIKVTCFNPGSVQTDITASGGVELSPNAVTTGDIASTLIHVLETADNYLVSEVTMRPLRPRG